MTDDRDPTEDIWPDPVEPACPHLQGGDPDDCWDCFADELAEDGEGEEDETGGFGYGLDGDQG